MKDTDSFVVKKIDINDNLYLKLYVGNFSMYSELYIRDIELRKSNPYKYKDDKLKYSIYLSRNSKKYDIKVGYIVFRTKTIKIPKDYKNRYYSKLCSSYTLSRKNEDFLFRVNIHKDLYIRDDWFSAPDVRKVMSSNINRGFSGLNRTKANFTVNNIRNPYHGGTFSTR